MIIYYNGEKVDTNVYCLAQVDNNTIKFFKDATEKWIYTFKDEKIAAFMWEFMRVSDIENKRIIDFNSEIDKIVLFKQQQKNNSKEVLNKFKSLTKEKE